MLLTTKYPQNIMHVVRMELGGAYHSTELDRQINEMSKIEIMDRYLASHYKNMKGNEIREVIEMVYQISLDTISANGEGSLLASFPFDIMVRVRESLKVDPASTDLDSQIMSMTKVEVMDRYLLAYGNSITGLEIRRIVNEIFGVNLSALATLDKARLSIFSKGQWILQNKTDIFSVYTGKGDKDVKISATKYFIEKIGSDQFPNELHDFLIDIGFSYHTDMKSYNYSNPTGQSISDSFKGQLIKTLVTFVQDHYYNLGQLEMA